MIACVYISSLIQSAYFLSLFDLVSILSKQFNAFKAKVGKKAGNTHISQDGGKYW